MRNTQETREVVAVRLADAERAQIANGAARMRLTLSAFVRQAALQASAILERKASVKPPEAPEAQPLIVLDERELQPEPTHYVDGEPVVMPRYGGEPEAV